MLKKITVVGVLAAAVVAGFFAVRVFKNAPSSTGASQRNGGNQPNGAQSAQNGSAGTHVNVEGIIVCLPYKKITAEDTACVIGLESADGKTYYGLMDQTGQQVSPEKVTTGSRTAISGTLAHNSDLEKTYDISGMIQMDSAPNSAP